MISISGLGPLLAGLGKAAGITVRAQKEVREEAEEMAERMRADAPVLTGALRDSIEVSHEGLSAEVGPTIRYAPFVEYGTYKDAPQPFALEAAEDEGLGERLLNLGGDI